METEQQKKTSMKQKAGSLKKKNQLSSSKTDIKCEDTNP